MDILRGRGSGTPRVVGFVDIAVVGCWGSDKGVVAIDVSSVG